MLIITGPNMSGKSTYMRQTALIVLMAQVGCFVPASAARIGVCDRIFTRIGASDNLAQGQSTFYVEMSELSYILNSATEKSLVILDEIGRGTSTYDGLSIAWATAEKLCQEKLKIRTMFATHYHEMTVLEEQLDGVRNLNIDVAEENGQIIFLHKIVPGSASKSYGVHVARLAGVPSDLLENAEAKLEKLEQEEAIDSVRDAFGSAGNVAEQNSVETNRDRGGFDGGAEAVSDGSQISFFSQNMSPAVEKLKALDIMETTPAEAIRILTELKELADKE